MAQLRRRGAFARQARQQGRFIEKGVADLVFLADQHRHPGTVAMPQIGVAVDVDPLDLEGETREVRLQRGVHSVTEMTFRARVQRELHGEIMRSSLKVTKTGAGRRPGRSFGLRGKPVRGARRLPPARPEGRG